MLDFFGLFGIGIISFIASNIDDTFILMLLFSSLRFQTRQIVIGQFIGIGVLIIISALGALVALVLPPLFIALMGLIPIAIGIKRLFEYYERNQTTDTNKTLEDKKRQNLVPFLAASGITIANGGDDLGVFTPLFAKYNTGSEVSTLIAIFMGLTLVWCALTFHFVNHPIIATRIKRIGDIITPFVLIGLGFYILADALII
jgi:cadmium resistance protein CadD (predicted permease)